MEILINYLINYCEDMIIALEYACCLRCNVGPCGGMVDATDSKSVICKDVGVRVSSGALL